MIYKNKYLIVQIDEKLIVFSKDEHDQKEIYSSKNEFNFIVLNDSEIAIKNEGEINISFEETKKEVKLSIKIGKTKNKKDPKDKKSKGKTN